MISAPRRPFVILLADDDEDDRLLVREALEETRAPGELIAFPDGARLLEHLARRADEGGEDAAPALVLIDLNMPGLDGREVLTRMRSDAALRALPVVVLTTSRAPEDVARAYALGANTVITKPSTFGGMVEVLRALTCYWFEVASLPAARAESE